ncbi:hypothetical protein EKO04_006706 [Ascochyta lentis]|uniref:BTB domain-containing protein n=1 Tax=Ascochyta lentis TaxID=205686 RepID=A0A8H7J3A3_9PLEO|nr:hypothetical protein EKO04_006706 [Ascochyta lentis]
MLQKSAPLFALASKGQPVTLPKLQGLAAHTLVNYLYTGGFQTLLSHAFSDDNPAYEAFKLPTCVYCAAIHYQLPSLAELSRQKIVYAGQHLSIFDILNVARDHAFPQLPEADQWYSEYLENAIHDAMSRDPEPFRRPDFITKVEGNSRLLQIVWKTVMSNYTAAPTLASSEQAHENGTETPLADSSLAESEVATQESFHQLPSPTESVLDSPPPPEPTKDLLKEPKHLNIASPALEKFESPATVPFLESVQNAQTDAAPNDDFGLPDIEPTVNHHEATNIITNSPEETKRLGHMRADSSVEEEVFTNKNLHDVKHGGLGDAVPATGNSNQDNAKKDKKKSKKKRSSIAF